VRFVDSYSIFYPVPLANHPNGPTRALADTQERVVALRLRLGSVKGNKLDPKAMHRAVERHNLYLKAWVDRRRKCLSVAEVIADGAERRVSDILVCIALLVLQPYSHTVFCTE